MATLTMPTMSELQANLQRISDQYTDVVKKAQERAAEYRPELPAFLADLPTPQQLFEQAVAIGRKAVEQQVALVRNLCGETQAAKTPAVKTPAVKTPAAKTAVKKTAAKKTAAKKTAARKTAAA